MHSPVVHCISKKGTWTFGWGPSLRDFFCEWWCWFGTIVQAFEAWLDPLFAIIVAAAVLKGRWILLAKSEKSCGAAAGAKYRMELLCKLLHKPCCCCLAWCVCVLCLPMTTLSENRRPEPMRHGDYNTGYTHIFFLLELDRRWELFTILWSYGSRWSEFLSLQ